MLRLQLHPSAPTVLRTPTTLVDTHASVRCPTPNVTPKPTRAEYLAELRRVLAATAGR